ncbi:hypothetical protein HOV03_gp78 [Gordonia phage Asapag]|uniref:Uncharacterized protein n=1 Tax=Gordonia phage Asapag TaxID=2507862 RepID=A0A410TDX1_9CAUD|nr:hypothetical protein HOV03_gp78 [Gordonia phage Asapag]QAU07218.1 hypothetical protein SEA_ASAPAG_78 [Gordonia phage Asapag]
MSDIGFGPVGDPPIIYDTERTDGYGRVTRLADRRLLEQAQARIVELAEGQELMQAQRDDIAHWNNVNYAKSCELLSELTEVRKVLQAEPERECDTAVAARRVVAERDHWRAEAEKARTRCSQLMHGIAKDDDLTPDASNPAHLRFAADVLIGAPMSASVADWLRAEADRLESEATADGLLPTVEESHQLDNATLDRLAGHFGVEVPATARRLEATADDVVEKADAWDPLDGEVRDSPCTVCGEQTAWGSRHHQSGSAVMQIERERDAALATIQQVRELADRWEREAGPDSRAEQVYGRQVVSVEFAVTTLRRILGGES